MSETMHDWEELSIPIPDVRNIDSDGDIPRVSVEIIPLAAEDSCCCESDAENPSDLRKLA